MQSSPGFRLTLFGSPSITGGDGVPVSGRATQRHRLALLALLALTPDRAARRDKLQAYLWPERDTEHARQLLNQAVYSLRKTMGEAALISVGEELRLNLQVLPCDVVEFETYLAGGELERAVGLYRGPLLDGLFLADAPEFEHWLDGVRERFAGRYAKALEALAEAAEVRQAHLAAVEWWKARALHDPCDSRIALRLMQALAASGNRPGAVQHAAAHQRVLQQELGAAPDPSVVALAARLRESPVAPLTAPPAQSLAQVAEPASVGVASGEPPMSTSVLPPAPPAQRQPRARHLGLATLLLVALVLGVREWGRSPEVTRSLVADQQTPGPRSATRNVAAHRFYLRGSDRILLRSDSAAQEALGFFQEAVALDSGYAAAWAGAARMHLRVAGGLPAAERERHLVLAEAAGRRALALDDSLADAHGALGQLRMLTFELDSAERYLTKAAELDPASSELQEWFVALRLWTGRPREALAHAERALELDPLSPYAHAEAARALLGNDRCEEALALLAKLADLQPPLPRAAPIAAECYARAGRWSDAIAALRPQAEGGGRAVLGQLGFLLARAGAVEEARGIQSALMDRWQHGEGAAFDVAMVYAGLSDHDQAFAWLDRARGDRSLTGASGNQVHLMLLGPLLADLHRDVRFARLLAELGVPRP